MNIAQWLYRSALASPDAPALLCGTQCVASYQEFANQACSLGHWLRHAHGISPGDRIAVYMPNRIEYLTLLYACWWTGAIAVPVNHMLHRQEAAWIARNSDTSIVFTDSGDVFMDTDLPEGCRELSIDKTLATVMPNAETHIQPPVRLDADTLAWLFYTSGTTGRPKGVMLSHGNLMAMSLCYTMDVDAVSPEHAILYAAPMSHGAGLYNFMYVRAGARHIVPPSRRFDSLEILQLARGLRHVSLFAAPTMSKRLVNTAIGAGLNGDGLRTIILGGAPMYEADFIEALDVLGPRFAQIYGQGESPMTITALPAHVINDRSHPRWRARLASVGTAQSCVEIRIVDDALNELPAGTCGEVLVRGPVVMKGYWANPNATCETLVDGWLRTGDIGYLSEDGFLTLTDRSKDVIITGGSNVYPREVEEVLARHPKVFETAVVGAPSPEWGEEVVAFVVARDGAELAPDDLEAWCLAQMASYKKPKRYVFAQDLPKNSYGKVLKTELRTQLAPQTSTTQFSQ